MKSLPEIFVSTDIETDGWVPGQNSILSIGSAAFFCDKTFIDAFSVNLKTLPESSPNPESMAWWQTQPKAWQACRENCQEPQNAMREYHKWLCQLPGQIIFVAEPLVFDFMFVDYYLQRFAGNNPFGFASIDIRSYIMGMKNLDFSDSKLNALPKKWFDNLPHTHIAIDDAIEQGTLFCNLLLKQQQMKLSSRPTKFSQTTLNKNAIK